MKTKLIKAIILLLLTVFISACGSDENVQDNRETVRVKGIKVEMQKSAQTYSFPGNVEGERKITISTKLMGRITSLPFEEGDKINAGQLLVNIDNDQLNAKKAQVEANYEEAKAGYENVKTNYDRMKRLHEKGSATQKEYDDISSAYKMAQAKLNAVEEAKNEIENSLTYAEIKAPFTGYITKKYVQKGDMANPGMPLLTVENLKEIRVKAAVPESDIYLIEVNDSVTVNVDAIPNENFSGKVIQVDAGADPASRQFTLLVSVENSGNMIKSGMFAKVILKKGTEETVLIPEKYLVERGQLTGVYTTAQNNEALLRWIRTGKTQNGNVEVLSGLNAGETILIPNNNFREGQKVTVEL